MLHTPTFGVDVSDMQKLEAILEQMLALPKGPTCCELQYMRVALPPSTARTAPLT